MARHPAYPRPLHPAIMVATGGSTAVTHFLFRYKVRLGLVSLVSCVAVGALLADLASPSPPVAQTTRTVVKGSLQGTNISGPTRTTATPPTPPLPSLSRDRFRFSLNGCPQIPRRSATSRQRPAQTLT